MSATIDAIHDRLSPRRAMTEATSMLKDATARRVETFVRHPSQVASDIVRGMTGHPIPVALAGGAAAATRMVFRAARRRRRARTDARIRHSLRLAMAGAAGVACWVIWKSIGGNGTSRLS
jgi:hypothetical protein